MVNLEPEPLTPTGPGPVMISWAHQPNLSDPEADEHEHCRATQAWEAQVRSFAVTLRSFGIDADADLFHPHDMQVNWNQYGPRRIQDSAVTLVVVNAAWRARCEGTGPATEGAGAAAEAAVLQAIYNKDRDDFHRRVKFIVLPGISIDDIPLQFSGVPYFTIKDFSLTGMEDLVRTLTGQPANLVPPLGAVPVLPPRTLARIEREAAAALSATSTLSVSAPAGAPAALRSGSGVASMHLGAGAAQAPSPSAATAHLELGAGAATAPGAGSSTAHLKLSAGLREDAALVEAALRLLEVPAPAPSPGAAVAPPPAREDERRQLQELSRRLTAALVEADRLTAVPDSLGDGPPAVPGQVATPPAAAKEQLAAQLRGVEGVLEQVDTCWLVMAGVLGPPPQLGWDQDPASLRQRREQQVTAWVERSAPAVLLSNPASAVRAPGRVIFTGSAHPARSADQSSQHWRLELGDRGEALAAANLTEHVPLDRDAVGGAGQPGQVPSDSTDGMLSLSVRRDLLELWVLTQLELLLDHARASLADPVGASGAVLSFQARLLLPAGSAVPPVHHFTVLEVVDEARDEDGRPAGARTPPGARPLPVSTTAPSTRPLTVSLATFAQPADVVRAARRLSIEVLEHFGVEDTGVLRADGSLDELAAAPVDQQAVYQHARAIGLPVDQVSPLDRERLYAERLAHARDAWRR